SVVAGPNLVRTPVSSNPPAAPVAPNSLAGSAVPPPVAAPAPDPIAALRARSERAPQDRSLATELCRAATLDAPSLGATGGAVSKTTVGGVADNRKKLDAAIADCGRALALAPESLMTRQRRAIDYLKSENWAQALEDFRGIAAVSPNDPVALFGQ